MNQKLLRALCPTTAFLVVLISASTLTANLDTIPIVVQQRIDTIVTFDMSSKKEKQEKVSSDIYNFIAIDTVTIFDFKTYEEEVNIVKRLIPVDKYVEMWLTEDKLLQNMANKKYYGIDTLTVFDSDTYEEFNSVYKRTHPCYYITW
ncbi:MAG: hypothetical protein HKN09_04925, partial [Saprospiraceae bacterium]|nr:hypothetical protein [Saprospiraceae bacterium]